MIIPLCMGPIQPLNYRGYPQYLHPINEVVCHGIPDETPLLEGDIVNVDVTTILTDMGICRACLIGDVPGSSSSG